MLRLAGLIVAATTIGTTTWYVGDFTGVRPVYKKEILFVQSEIDQLTQNQLWIQFNFLMQKRQFGGLTFEEQQQLCKVAKLLNYVGVPGC